MKIEAITFPVVGDVVISEDLLKIIKADRLFQISIAIVILGDNKI
jgi:hypothetical protein